MSDEGITGGDIFLIPVSGGAARNLTSGIKASPSWLTWRDANEILLAESVDGQSALATLQVSTGTISTLWKGSDSNSTGGFNPEVSIARRGTTSALVLQSFLRAPEIWGAQLALGHKLLTSILERYLHGEMLRASIGEMKAFRSRGGYFSLCTMTRGGITPWWLGFMADQLRWLGRAGPCARDVPISIRLRC